MLTANGGLQGISLKCFLNDFSNNALYIYMSLYGPPDPTGTPASLLHLLHEHMPRQRPDPKWMTPDFFPSVGLNQTLSLHFCQFGIA